MIVRPAGIADFDLIRRCVDAAFGQCAEGRLVDALRRDGAAAIECVADDDGKVVGHVMLSRLVSPRGALALAPLSVAPGRQRQGVGSALMRRAVDDARAAGFSAIFILGDPAYYGRFGFSAAAAAAFQSPYPKESLTALALATDALDALEREIVYADAFADLD